MGRSLRRAALAPLVVSLFASAARATTLEGAFEAVSDADVRVGLQALSWLAENPRAREADEHLSQSQGPHRLIEACVRQRDPAFCPELFVALRALPLTAEREQAMLIAFADDPINPGRAFAIEALGFAPHLREPKALIRLLADPNEQVSSTAAKAVARHAGEMPGQAEAISELLSSEVKLTQRAALVALGGFRFLPQPVVLKIIGVLGWPDGELRALALDLVGRLPLGDAELRGAAQAAAKVEKADPRFVQEVACALGLGFQARYQPASLSEMVAKCVGNAATRVRTIDVLVGLGRPLDDAWFVGDDEATTAALSRALSHLDGALPKARALWLVERVRATGSYPEDLAAALDKITPADLLQSDLLRPDAKTGSIPATVVQVLKRASQARQLLTPKLLADLNTDHQGLRDSAAQVLASGVSLDQPQLAQLVASASNRARCCEALQVLQVMGPSARAYSPAIAKLLDGGDERAVLHVAQALAQIGLPPDEVAFSVSRGEIEAALVQLAKGAASALQQAALEALGMDEIMARRHVDLFASALDRPEDAMVSIDVLARYPSLARPLASKMLPTLARSLPQTMVVDRMAGIAPLDPGTILELLELSAEDSGSSAQFRFAAYVLSGGDQASLHLISWLGAPGAFPTPDPEIARATAVTLSRHWPVPGTLPRIREEMALRVEPLVARGSWEAADLPVLSALQARLEAQGTQSASLSAVLLRFRMLGAVRTVGAAILAHLLFWTLLLFAYPRSPRVQAFMIWSKWPRRIFGFWYVEQLLLNVPFLRSRLFAPFSSALTGEASSSEGQAEREYYFDASLVKFIVNGTESTVRLVDALARIRGHVVLEGASGLGKSIFIRRLVRESKRLIAYLPADRCSKGVQEAIEAQLQGVTRDASFLASLVFAGGLDVCIDGLNEVNAETRAAITHFISTHPHTNILVATQPLLDWKAPGRMLQLQPLEGEQIVRFLQQWPSGAADPPRYRAACEAFVAEALRAEQPAEVLASNKLVLSNPMDLTLVAQMLVRDQRPDLLRLQEQQFELAARRYRRSERTEFPLKSFADAVYKMRSQDETSLEWERFSAEINALAAEKIVLKRFYSEAAGGREAIRWTFRHDKLMEFFIVRAFLVPGAALAEQHLDDPRFRGVYLLMATQMPIESAAALRERLIMRAAETNDHTVVDRFVQLFASRQQRAQAPLWAARFVVPREPELAALVQQLAERRGIAEREYLAAVEQHQRARSFAHLVFETSASLLAQLVKDALGELGATPGKIGDGQAWFRFTDPNLRTWSVLLLPALEQITGPLVTEGLADARADLGAQEKLLVLANHAASIPPEHRPAPFAADAIRAATDAGAVLMTTVELFQAIVDVQRGAVRAPRFWEQLHGQAGVAGAGVPAA